MEHGRDNIMIQTPKTTSPPNILHPCTSITTLTVFLVFVRFSIGLNKHSGQNTPSPPSSLTAGFGDYEAQRHWMELTFHLPINSWYYYDLPYWGLDYPPLTAYTSKFFGFVTHHLLSPAPVELFASRGYEDPTHKSFMRLTVILLDITLYFTAGERSKRRYGYRLQLTHSLVAVYAITKTIVIPANLPKAYTLALLQPAILLIDHGHFQYNTTALGLSLWSFYFITKKSTTKSFCWNKIFGSIFFALALNFKQMTLYYAPAVFAYLLGWCFQTSVPISQSISRFATLGAAVISTFAVLWVPFYIYPADNVSRIDSVLQVLKVSFTRSR